MEKFTACLRCGFPENDSRHDKTSHGWHTFRGQDYLDALEDALLFVYEKKQPHDWVETGMTITTFPSFPEKKCRLCGAINWGGKEDGICFGNHHAESAVVAAHNRRTLKGMSING